MEQPPFVSIYVWLVENIEKLGINTFSASQDVPKKMPVCRVQMISNNATTAFGNARQYTYTFQIDVVDAQDKLRQSLINAYKIMQLCREVSIEGYNVSCNDPSLTPMVDSSTNQILNRQIIRINYTTIETTAF